jgi:hypothetical protein
MSQFAGRAATLSKATVNDQANVCVNLVSMVNCVTNAYRCQDVIMGTVTRALSATVIKAGMVCFVEMPSVNPAVIPQEVTVNGQGNAGVV